MLATISVWLVGSHNRTLSVFANATSAVIAAGLGGHYVPLVVLGHDHDLELAVVSIWPRDPVGVESLHPPCLLTCTRYDKR